MKPVSFISVFIFLLLSVGSVSAQYSRDILGDNYESRKIVMPRDYDGDVICTLIRKTNQPATRQAVLYIHGYNDYFFQKNLGDSINSFGYNFYAIDLRKYGRSILREKHTFFCKSLDEYIADIDTALQIMHTEGIEKVVLMGHSTGGLISAYYMKKRNNPDIAGMILNSPFLDWNFGWMMENIVMPAVSFIGRFIPYLTVQGTNVSSYAHSLLKSFKGEWNFNTDWKKPEGFPKKAGWIHAIHSAQQYVQEGGNWECPTLVLSSDQSFPETEDWNDRYLSSDIVLDVNDIQRYGQRLGQHPTCKMIPGGIHDLILSPLGSRNETYRLIREWLKQL